MMATDFLENCILYNTGYWDVLAWMNYNKKRADLVRLCLTMLSEDYSYSDPRTKTRLKQAVEVAKNSLYRLAKQHSNVCDSSAKLILHYINSTFVSSYLSPTRPTGKFIFDKSFLDASHQRILDYTFDKSELFNFLANLFISFGRIKTQIFFLSRNLLTGQSLSRPICSTA